MFIVAMKNFIGENCFRKPFPNHPDMMLALDENIFKCLDLDQLCVLILFMVVILFRK